MLRLRTACQCVLLLWLPAAAAAPRFDFYGESLVRLATIHQT